MAFASIGLKDKQQKAEKDLQEVLNQTKTLLSYMSTMIMIKTFEGEPIDELFIQTKNLLERFLILYEKALKSLSVKELDELLSILVLMKDFSDSLTEDEKINITTKTKNEMLS